MKAGKLFSINSKFEIINKLNEQINLIEITTTSHLMCWDMLGKKKGSKLIKQTFKMLPFLKNLLSAKCLQILDLLTVVIFLH